ncbi:MAG: ABC transporter substrate-binding protein [Ruminococcus flavefaciens]|nr:ABC transporter substrate-binding protein [Ruminococcus flavefaciens]
MNKLKIFISSLVIASMSLTFTACGENNDKSDINDVDPALRKAISKNAKNSELLTGELENKKIKWLSSWDINSSDNDGKSTPAFLVAFQERYGGSIEWYQCTYEERYEQLAKAINGDEGIDFFYAGDLDAFPKGAVRSMFIPADDYIDFSSPLWDDVRELNDSFIWNGSHYIISTRIAGDNCGVIYNRKTILESGLQDPAELYAKGEWNWNTFEEMLSKFSDPQNQRYGIDGWWFEFGLTATTGIPAVSIDDGKLVNNLSNPAIELVQNWIYELYQKNYIAIGSEEYGWNAKPAYIGEGKTLFYPCGLYQFYKKESDWKSTFGDDAFFVPMPKDPESDEYYIPVGMEAYAFVKGGHNPEGVAKFLECKRFVFDDEEILKIADKQMKDDYGWTDEMFDMKESMQALAEDNPVIDISKGVSEDCGELLDNSLRLTARGTPWSETYDSINSVVDKYIDEVNSNSQSE